MNNIVKKLSPSPSRISHLPFDSSSRSPTPTSTSFLNIPTRSVSSGSGTGEVKASGMARKNSWNNLMDRTTSFTLRGRKGGAGGGAEGDDLLIMQDVEEGMDEIVKPTSSEEKEKGKGKADGGGIKEAFKGIGSKGRAAVQKRRSALALDTLAMDSSHHTPPRTRTTTFPSSSTTLGLGRPSSKPATSTPPRFKDKPSDSKESTPPSALARPRRGARPTTAGGPPASSSSLALGKPTPISTTPLKGSPASTHSPARLNLSKSNSPRNGSPRQASAGTAGAGSPRSPLSASSMTESNTTATTATSKASPSPLSGSAGAGSRAQRSITRSNTTGGIAGRAAPVGRVTRSGSKLAQLQEPASRAASTSKLGPVRETGAVSDVGNVSGSGPSTSGALASSTSSIKPPSTRLPRPTSMVLLHSSQTASNLGSSLPASTSTPPRTRPQSTRVASGLGTGQRIPSAAMSSRLVSARASAQPLHPPAGEGSEGGAGAESALGKPRRPASMMSLAPPSSVRTGGQKENKRSQADSSVIEEDEDGLENTAATKAARSAALDKLTGGRTSVGGATSRMVSGTARPRMSASGTGTATKPAPMRTDALKSSSTTAGVTASPTRLPRPPRTGTATTTGTGDGPTFRTSRTLAPSSTSMHLTTPTKKPSLLGPATSTSSPSKETRLPLLTPSKSMPSNVTHNPSPLSASRGILARELSRQRSSSSLLSSNETTPDFKGSDRERTGSAASDIDAKMARSFKRHSVTLGMFAGAGGGQSVNGSPLGGGRVGKGLDSLAGSLLGTPDASPAKGERDAAAVSPSPALPNGHSTTGDGSPALPVQAPISTTTSDADSQAIASLRTALLTAQAAQEALAVAHAFERVVWACEAELALLKAEREGREVGVGSLKRVLEGGWAAGEE